ncbi:MAG: hypothetical protein ABL998_02670 [Planctomycetota bacterium]
MPLTLALLLWLAPSVDPTPRLRVAEGAARLVTERDVRALDPRSGGVALESASAYVECGARSELELAWRGVASVELAGPAAFEFGSAPRLALDSFRSAELEARRGVLSVEVSGLMVFELRAGAVRLLSSPAGVDVLNRGGATLELCTLAGKKVRVEPGRSVRITSER